jgi:hypothetical protein
MRPGGPISSGGDGTLLGVYYALVTDNKDPEKLARVKIRLPWMPNGADEHAHWAVLAVPFAGEKFGWYTVPDNGDLVAVIFIAGDISRPVVLGGVWSQKDPPPEDNSGGKNDFRGYKSRSGSRVVLDDSSSSKVYIADGPDKQGLCVGAFQQGGSGPNAKGAPPPSAANGSSAQMGVNIWTGAGDLEISAKGKLVVKAKTHIDIVSGQHVDLKAQGEATFEASTTNTCTGNAGAKVEGSSTEIN